MEEPEIINMTLCLIRDGDGQVLLGKKGPNRKIGSEMWNGFGGGEEEGDIDIYDTARREVLEETSRKEKSGEIVGGIVVGELMEQGVVDFKFPAKNRINRVHMFSTTDWEGTPVKNEEMVEFQWFTKETLPTDEMLAADSHFIPELMEGKTIKAEFVYDNEFHLQEYKIEEIQETEPESHIELKLR